MLSDPISEAAALVHLSAAAARLGVKWMPRRARGFTLPELLTAMALLAIIAALVAPRYAASISNYRASLAARQLAADLALAQTTARAASASRTVTFDVTNSRYTVSGLTGLNNTGATYTISLRQSPLIASIGSIVFTDNNPDNQISFDGYGLPDSGATITVRSGSAIRTVTLDGSTGATTVQ